MTRNLYRQFAVITLFAIAMAFLESAVVVYLREIFYPEGFAFPLKLMSGKIALTEIYRELATMVMLATIGFLAGKNRMQRFGVFLFAFGTWDIFYYIFLKFLIGWPESLLTWDILFLIPVTWVGPVLAPSLNALTMCILGGMIYFKEGKDIPVRFGKLGWSLLIAGSLIILVSYTQDYLNFMMVRMSVADLFRPASSEKVMSALSGYIPEKFNWWLFATGQVLLVTALVIINYRTAKPGRKSEYS